MGCGRGSSKGSNASNGAAGNGNTLAWTFPRAQRLWLAIALATWWLLSVGGEAEAALPVETLPTVPGAARRQNNGGRWVGILRQGWNFDCCGFAQPSDDPHRARCPATLANSATDGMLAKKPTLVRGESPGPLARKRERGRHNMAVLAIP
jgi:hypothetical protein